MISRQILIPLVFAFFLLVVAFAVVMGAFALSYSAGDAPGAAVLMWIGRAILMLLAVDVLLLIGALGVNALASPDRDDRRDRSP